MSELREKLAALCHEQWSGWMKYLFLKSNELQGGVVAIPQLSADRWKRQMNTPYADLPTEEQDSDRAEADKFLALLSENTESIESVREQLEQLRERSKTREDFLLAVRRDELRIFAKAIGLLNSMVAGGEQHSEQSRQIVDDALEIINQG